MLIKEQEAEECDATKMPWKAYAGYTIIKLTIQKN